MAQHVLVIVVTNPPADWHKVLARCAPDESVLGELVSLQEEVERHSI